MFRAVKTFVFYSAFLLCALSSFAGETSTLVKTRLAPSSEVKLGYWHKHFEKCWNFCKKNGAPLIAVWSNGDKCGHCIKFESACNSKAFKTWMKTSGCVFYFIHSGDSGDYSGNVLKKGDKTVDGKIESDVFHWCRADKNTDFPFVRIYWTEKGKSKPTVDIATIGDVVDSNLDGESGGKAARDYFKGKLKKYTPIVIEPDYAGGSFAIGAGNLEAEVGNTKFVDVPVVRTGAAVNLVYTNKLVVAYPDGTAETNALAWARGDDDKSWRVATDGSHGMVADSKVLLTLLDASGKAIPASVKAVDKTDIALVAEPENSPKNPRWIGERTSETLAFGEWTMDIDAATNKQDRVHTLLLFGGPLWCPDCINAEEKLFATEEFNMWAKDNKVACVAIDEPPFAAGLDAPTLLSNEKGPDWAPVSGAGYISRKMIPLEGNGGTNATDILERNLAYVQNDTAHGGFCTPDNMDGTGNAGIWGTGIPCVIALRKDGSVAGRLYQFSNDFRSEGIVDTPVEVLLKRLDELFAQDAEGDARFVNEDLNDSRRTTPESIGMRDTAEGTLSFIDGADVYRLKPEETNGRRINFTLTADPGVGLALDVITVSGDKEKVIAAASGPTCPIDIAANINSSNAYVRVRYLTDEDGYSFDPQFALTNANSTLFGYTLSTDFVVEPKEVGETVTLTGSPEMTVALVSNEVYRITNFAGLPGTLEETTGSTNCLFRSLVSDDVRLTLTAMTSEVQLWHPGKAGFAVEKATALEALGSYTIRLVREGGVSGRAVVKLTWDESASSEYKDLIELPGVFNEPFVWENGDDADKTVTVRIVNNKFADGDQFEYFDATVGGNAAEGIVRLKVTIRDDDRKMAGRIAISRTDPSLAKGMTGYARLGSEMKIALEREDGADGEQKVSLAATAGTLDQTSFVWPNRTMETKIATLTLPSSGKSVKVTMTPAKGSSVDASRRTLTVNLLAADVPGFVRSEISESATRYVPIKTIAVAVDSAYVQDWSKIKVAKFSGSLPSGVTWKLENIQDKEEKQLVISGVPTKAGNFTAVFRVSEGSKAGLTVAVTVCVVDPVVTGGGEVGLDPLNASVKTSRTFSNVPVWDVTAKELAGWLTLTVPRTGKLSAKYVTVDAAKAASFSSKSWSGIEPDGTLTAQLTGKVGSLPATVNVTVPAKGQVTAVLTYAGREGLFVDIPANIWSKKNTAKDFKGYYTVQLPATSVRSGNLLATGCGYVTLKMNTTSAINAGKFAFAGLLPNGKSFSGSATLVAKDWVDGEGFDYWSRGVLPILTVSADDTVAGAVEINPGAADPNAKDYDEENGFATGRCYYRVCRRVVRSAKETTNVEEGGILWRHVEKDADVSSVATLDAWGCYYDETENFQTLCKNALGSSSLKLFALKGLNELPADLIGDGAVEGALAKGRWLEKATNLVAGVTVSYAKATSKAKTKTSQIKTADSKKLSLTFTLSSGVLNGTFKLPMETGSVTFTYKGVVLPGFGYGDCTACGYDMRTGGIEAAMMPFAAGTAWANDTFRYDDEKGKTRKLTVRRSTPFSVGVNPGE